MRSLNIDKSITNRETQSLEAYFREVGKVELITAEEEVLLAKKIKLGDRAALERLISANLRFVISIAKKYQHQGLPLSDLISEGNLGLITAAKRFDETRGFKFISFAVWWIRQSIMEAITENFRIVRLPTNKLNELAKIKKATIAFEQQTMREPTCEQLAGLLEMPPEKVRDALLFAPRTASYDAPLSGEDEFSILDMLGDEGSRPDGDLLRESYEFEFRAKLDSLNLREKQVIELAFGITGGLEMSALEVARQLGIHPEKVRKLRRHALKKLRKSTYETKNLC
jgi:RNA polymerase primary sigma factor